MGAEWRLGHLPSKDGTGVQRCFGKWKIAILLFNGGGRGGNPDRGFRDNPNASAGESGEPFGARCQEARPLRDPCGQAARDRGARPQSRMATASRFETCGAGTSWGTCKFFVGRLRAVFGLLGSPGVSLRGVSGASWVLLRAIGPKSFVSRLSCPLLGGSCRRLRGHLGLLGAPRARLGVSLGPLEDS